MSVIEVIESCLESFLARPHADSPEMCHPLLVPTQGGTPGFARVFPQEKVTHLKWVTFFLATKNAAHLKWVTFSSKLILVSHASI